jgi:hypothetical protein
MKKLLLLFILAIPVGLWAQQLPERSPFGETGFLWNPAMTAPWTYYEIDAGFRQEWLGFEDAPQTAYLGIQYPFEKENMSLGGYFMHDAVNPVKTNTFALTYAYKLEPGFKRYDQLSDRFNGKCYPHIRRRPRHSSERSRRRLCAGGRKQQIIAQRGLRGVLYFPGARAL